MKDTMLSAAELSIVPLPRETWKGTPVPLRYTTEEYYDLEMTREQDGFQVHMVRRRFEAPVTHSPEEYDFPDGLYQDYWEKAEAWGVVAEDNGERKLLACIEICPEEWRGTAEKHAYLSC